MSTTYSTYPTTSDYLRPDHTATYSTYSTDISTFTTASFRLASVPVELIKKEMWNHDTGIFHFKGD